MTPGEAATALRTACAALETGDCTVDVHIPLHLFSGIHAMPGETLRQTVPVTLSIKGPPRVGFDATQVVNPEVARLRRALEHIRSLGDAGAFVAGTPLANYVTAALDGDTA